MQEHHLHQTFLQTTEEKVQRGKKHRKNAECWADWSHKCKRD